MFETINID